jgi:hypothetical protein
MVEESFLLSTISHTYQCKRTFPFKIMPPAVQTEYCMCVPDAWHNTRLAHRTVGTDHSAFIPEFPVAWHMLQILPQLWASTMDRKNATWLRQKLNIHIGEQYVGNIQYRRSTAQRRE